MLKKFFHWLFGSIFASSISLIIITISIVVVFTPDNFKSWIGNSGVYKTLPDTLIGQLSKQSQATGQSSIDFKDENVQSAAKKALSSEYIETSTNQFIDGNFNWLEGRSSEPDYEIDVLSAKEVFANELTQYAKTRYQGLPACARGAFPKSTDPLKIDCRPPIGVDIDEITNIYKVEILNSKDFLPEPTLTYKYISPNISNYTYIPRIYKLIKLLPFILIASAFISAMLFVPLDESKRQGFRKVGRRLVVSSFITFLLILLSSYGIDKLRTNLLNNNNTEELTEMVKQVTLSIVNSVQADIVKTSGIISAAILVLGLIIVLATRERKTPKEDKKTADKYTLPKVPPATPELKKETTPEPEKVTRPEPTTAPVIKPTNRPKPPLIQ